MKLGVAVVTHDSADVITECLTRVTSLLPDTRVCVVDNDSGDATLSRAAAVSPLVDTLSSGGNRGYAAACNLAFGYFEDCGVELVLVLNPDVLLVAATEAALGSAFGDPQTNHVVGVEAGTGAPFLAAATPNSFEMLRYSVLLVLPPRLARSAVRAFCPSGTAMHASGALLAVRTAAWRSVGGFDEDYFLYYEDRDLSERLQKCGALGISMGVRGMHFQGGSSTAPTGFSLRSALSGWLMYVAKHDGRAAARLWCARTATVQRLVLAALVLPAALGSTRAARKKSELRLAAAFLRSGLDDSLVTSDPPSRTLRRALQWGC